LFAPPVGYFLAIEPATPYGHVDMSVEIDALRALEKNGKVRPELARKILQDNPARFYGIQ
jgi:hypothetical protein